VAKWLSCAKEPIHYVTYGSGMQTWDACPQLAGPKDHFDAQVSPKTWRLAQS